MTATLTSLSDFALRAAVAHQIGDDFPLPLGSNDFADALFTIVERERAQGEDFLDAYTRVKAATDQPVEFTILKSAFVKTFDRERIARLH